MKPTDSEAAARGGDDPGVPVLVSDFDGTMTRRDFYLLARGRWWQEGGPDPWQEYLAGRLTHFEALNRFFAAVKTDEASLVAMLAGMELDPTLPAALARLDAAGWRLVIASAGCEWYIRRLLAGVGVPYTLHANPGRFDPEHGLVMELPAGSPFFSPSTGIDKVAVVRDALARHRRVVFAGDGPPDVAAARLVPAGCRFARGYLAGALRSAGEEYHALVNWEDLASRLLGEEDP